MKPEFNSRRLFGITRSKGKMYELGLPERFHLELPQGSKPDELFLLTIGTLGDVAAAVNELAASEFLESLYDDLGFSASFFDAFLESKFSTDVERDTTLLAASAYYLARRPGSSLVLARQLDAVDEEAPVDRLLRWILLARWSDYPEESDRFYGNALSEIARLVASHFRNGSGLSDLIPMLTALRRRAYDGASARDLLFVDIIAAVVRMRMAASAWTTLPRFTGIPSEQWAPAISRHEFPKELWPSQVLLGRAGIFSGASGIVQMPTSAGKTRSIEIILRSSFLSGRTKLAVVVAPFRALCHEIGSSLRYSFREDDVRVNELSDAMQLDFVNQVAELFGTEPPASQYILVLTPEKLLFVLRQTPGLINDIGLVVYDEGHQFDSGSRGITYELLVTEIKALLPAGAQTVLVSAVIQNANSIGEWLIGEKAQVVDGTGLLTTARSVAFASWIDRRGQLIFFETDSYKQADYFVPRVIEQNKLTLRGKERRERHFPELSNSNDIALYLGVRLVPNGAVAIFCGRKDTASNLASRAVDIYARDFSLEPPSASANKDELRGMVNLIDRHFGDHSVLSQAAALGIFVHHGATPHGIRLSIEYAMQQGLINFVACTSTLAQGVNLPIRYLIVSGVQQGTDKIKVRDFQNLIGRAGRSGMHTEGLVIFSDPSVYDKRLTRKESWKFRSSVDLLAPRKSEDTTSSLLGLLEPLRNIDGKAGIRVSADSLCNLLLSGEAEWLIWANSVVNRYPEHHFDAGGLVTQLRKRRKLLFAVESYLMANRGAESFEQFRLAARSLAEATLAHHLAEAEIKPGVVTLFSAVAEYVNQQEPSVEKQSRYSKTLLGVRSAREVETWVLEKRESLLGLASNEAWLEMSLPLFSAQSDDKFFHTIEPASLGHQLALQWLLGHPYQVLIEMSDVERGTKPWGLDQRRRLTADDIVGFCDSTLGFESSLVLAAVAQFLFGNKEPGNNDDATLLLFQKALKYGLPDALTISCFEYGFADRVIAQTLAHVVREDGFEGEHFASAVGPHREKIETALRDFPSYFHSVLKGR
jgi:hypothetical protein